MKISIYGRMWQQASNRAIFQAHPAVSQVFYPGLEANEHYELASHQMRGFGGLLSFALHGGFEAARAILPRLHYAHRAANLGAVETIVGVPATTSHVESTPQERAAMGIPESLLRYSVGIEDADDLLADLAQALTAIQV
ncbi:MAG TPA: PLP-dependent transferase [Ktedonobacteraceae bacterium]|nr:PLP-dependent transferase [Ktedonobacteraceae bacterium]